MTSGYPSLYFCKPQQCGKWTETAVLILHMVYLTNLNMVNWLDQVRGGRNHEEILLHYLQPEFLNVTVSRLCDHANFPDFAQNLYICITEQ